MLHQHFNTGARSATHAKQNGKREAGSGKREAGSPAHGKCAGRIN